MNMQETSFRTRIPVHVMPPKLATPAALPKVALVRRMIEKGVPPQAALRVVMAQERANQTNSLPGMEVPKAGKGRPDLLLEVPAKKARIMEELHGRPRSTANIISATGFSRTSTARLLHGLVDDGKIKIVGKAVDGTRGILWGLA